MTVAHKLAALKDRLRPSDRLPVVFIGHGSPMNAIEDTPFSRSWSALGRALPKPQAILVVSAHWMTRGSILVDVSNMPRTTHDFHGFPAPLYEEQYPAKGHPALAQEVVSLLDSHKAQDDDCWGLDHGAWTILKFLYPDADVPVFQISIDMAQPLEEHVEIGRILSVLRDRGVLILGSGNVVHNLGEVSWRSPVTQDWAVEFDTLFANRLEDRDMTGLAVWRGHEALFARAHPSVDHYIPALTIAGAARDQDQLTYINDSFDLGTISMRSFMFHS